MNHFFCKLKILVFTLFIPFLLPCVFSQESIISDIKFRNLSTKEGLSSNSVQCCLVDSYGFLWIGTYGGLNRYDGNSIKVYEHSLSDSNSLSDNFIYSIYEDDEHILWIGTNMGGLNRFDLKTENFSSFKYNKSDSNSISNNTIYSITQDNEKNLWVATAKGLNKLDKKTFKFTRYYHNPSDSASIPSNKVNYVYKDISGNIFICTLNGLAKYNINKNSFSKIKLINNDNFEINSITQDKYGIFWIGAESRGIFKYKEKSGNTENFMPDEVAKNKPESKFTISNFVKSIVVDNNGNIWIGHNSEKAGVDVYDPKTKTFYNFTNDKNDNMSLCWDVIWYIYKDKNENIYICTNGGGISYFNPNGIKFRHFTKLQKENFKRDIKVVWSLAYAYDRIWCFTEGMVLSFNEFGSLIKEYPIPLTKLKLHSPFYKSRTGKFFIGTVGIEADIMAYYDNQKDMFIKCPIKLKYTETPIVQTYAIYEDKDSNIWLATNSGLRLLDKDYNEKEIFYHSESDKNSIFGVKINRIIQTSDGNIWFGGDGLSRFDIKTRKFTSFEADYKSSNSPGSTIVYDFYEDKNNNLWIAYSDNGFDKYDLKTGTFKHYNTENGLINNCIYGILPDNSGNLWFSTNKGIVKFNPEKETFTNYSKSDGIQDDEFNVDSYCRSENGLFVFGGVNGINCFYPDKIKSNLNIPHVVLTSFKIFDKELDLPVNICMANEIKLTYKENFFTIRFAALDYANPSKNQYEYKLEGIDKDWIKSGNKNEANYTDIEPGDYVFRVKGTNNDGIRNEEGLSLKVIITPPWWQRWWFKGSAAIIIIGFIGYGIKRRFNVIKKEKNMQQEFMRKLIDSQEQERKKLSAELHDSLGQDLIIIKNSAGMALNNFDKKDNAEKFIKQISEISSSALHNVRVISHNLRPAELDKLGLTETIKTIIEMVSSSSEIIIESNIDNIDKVFDKNNEVNFCRIIQECLNNILKHSKATKASVQIKSEGSQLVTKITDNGIGFDYYDLMNKSGMKSFGLTGISERVKMLNGTLKINSGPGQGTEILIINTF